MKSTFSDNTVLKIDIEVKGLDLKAVCFYMCNKMYKNECALKSEITKKVIGFLCTDGHGAQRINPLNLGDPLTFP